jgi:hypothetical protein
VHEKKLDGKRAIVKSSFTRREVDLLLKNALDYTEEIAFNVPLSYQPKRGRTLERVYFQGFEVRSQFPQNLVCSKDGRIVACDGMKEELGEIVLYGRCVTNLREIYPGSKAVGCAMTSFGKAGQRSSCLGSANRVRLPASDVKSKVAPFPQIPSHVQLTGKQIQAAAHEYNLENWHDWFFMNMLP